jgi:hypothetical protein
MGLGFVVRVPVRLLWPAVPQQDFHAIVDPSIRHLDAEQLPAWRLSGPSMD